MVRTFFLEQIKMRSNDKYVGWISTWTVMHLNKRQPVVCIPLKIKQTNIGQAHDIYDYVMGIKSLTRVNCGPRCVLVQVYAYWHMRCQT